MRWIFALAALLSSSAFAAYDHTHAAWDALLKKYVHTIDGGNASQVSYAGFMKDHAALKAVLDADQKVTRAEYDGWTKPQQQAFLIDMYNGETIEKILTRYPDIKSIRDFGTVFGNPWKDKFFTLFGEPAYLDKLEHEMLRKEGVYDDPRVHVAVVCASIGCPMLRPEAYTGDKLEAQLDEQFRRFLSDRKRNRYDPASGKLQVSRIFDWYGKDFERGHKGFTSLRATFARYADQLADKPEDRAKIRAQQVDIGFLDYDWGLNDTRP